MELFRQNIEGIKTLLQKKIGNDGIILETLLYSNYGNNLNQNQFTRILKKVKNSDFQLQNQDVNNTCLNIDIRDDTLGVKIYGDSNISNYCENNKIENVIESVEIIDSIYGKNNKLSLDNYNLKLNLKEEKRVTRKSARGAKIINELFKYDKLFRYIKTYSFISSDELFQVNFNIYKSSHSEEITNKGGKMAKKDVKFFKKKFVRKPKGEKRTFSLWWNSLNDTDEVELSDEKFMKKLTYKSLDDSGTLENELEYEISIKVIGQNIEGKTRKEKNDNLYQSYIKLVETLLKTLQQSDNIISEYEIRQVKGKFKSLTSLYNFRQSFPFSKTLENKHIIRLPIDQYNENVNIRKNYCVTEKADGERDLLYIDDKGNVYLINRQELVRKTGMVIENYANSLLDGEFVTKLKGGYDIKLFLVFDLYFCQGEDYRERAFMRMNKKDQEVPISRLEKLNEMLKEIEVESNLEKQMEIRAKEFLYGNYNNPSENGLKRIEKYEIEMENLDVKSEDYNIKLNECRSGIDEELKDTKIFECAEQIITRMKNQDYEYDTDGLIFTPINLTVGEEPESNKKNKYGGRWGRSFKWKSSEENSIDFQVEFAKNQNGEYIDKLFMDDMSKYRKVYLKVAYDKKNMFVNRAKIVNENPLYLDGYNSVLFEPTTNFEPRTFECFLKLTNNGGLVCKGEGNNVGDVIKDGSIIEFYYDYKPNSINKEHKFRWVPMRKRENLVPNSFETANNIWNTIFEPISEESIKTGRNIIQYSDQYYSSNKKEKNIFKSFHNLLKKNLINNVVTPGATLLDIGTGECGDIHKWLGTDLSSVVGIEYNQYNINNNINGGFKRIVQAMNSERYANKDLVKNIFLIWGDGSKNIVDGSSGMDKLNKFYIDVLWGNQVDREMKYLLRSKKLKDNVGKFKDGFNIVSCQFCMHYFFKDRNTLKEFLININQNLIVGGKFISTCFDGRKIFKILDEKNEIEQKNEDGKTLWKISKKYKEKTLQNDESSLGMPIGVYVNTFNKMEDEYLINIDYLEKILPDFGLEIESCEPFEKHYNEFRANGTLEDELLSESSEFSFLNMAITIVKKMPYQSMVGGAKVNVEKFLSNRDLITDETSDYGLKVLDEDSGSEQDEEQEVFGKVLDLDEEPITKESIKSNINELIGGFKEEDVSQVDSNNSDVSPVDLDVSPVDLDVSPVDLDLDLPEVDLSQTGGSKESESNLDLDLPEVDLSQTGGSKESESDLDLDLPEVDLSQTGGSKESESNLDLDLPEVDLSQTGGSKESESDLSQTGGSKETESNLDLPEVNLTSEVEQTFLNPNVKVIKIDADLGTLNMINK